MDAYANGLFIAGAIIVIIGTLSSFGSNKIIGNINYRNAQTVGSEGLTKRYYRDIKMIDDSYGFVVFASICGGALMLLSALIQAK